MIDLRTIDEMTRKLADSLPPGLAQKKSDLEAQFRTGKRGYGGGSRLNTIPRWLTGPAEIVDQPRRSNRRTRPVDSF